MGTHDRLIWGHTLLYSIALVFQSSGKSLSFKMFLNSLPYFIVGVAVSWYLREGRAEHYFVRQDVDE